MIKKISASVFALSLFAGVSGTAQAALATGAVLDFADGIGYCQFGGTYPDCDSGAATVLNGSYIGMDTNGNGIIDGVERIAIKSAGTGVTLDYAQAAGEIDLDWIFAGISGRHLTKNPLSYVSTGVNTYEIDMSGWTINWNGNDIDAGTGTGAVLTCSVDCANGDTFVLDYSAIIDPRPKGGSLYVLHFEGVISSVPVPAAVWLFGSGLLGLAGVACRRRVV